MKKHPSICDNNTRDLKLYAHDAFNKDNHQSIDTSNQDKSLIMASRRKTFQNLFSMTLSTILLSKASPANALDMDAFMNKELDTDKTKSVESDDVKTCKYAAPGKEKGDACVRASMSTSGKKGGVDAYGNIDRGDYVKCQTSYPMVDGKYVKTVTCK